MGLQAEPPFRVRAAIVEGSARVAIAIGPVHGLQEEMVEGEAFERRRRRAGLRVDELELMPRAHRKLGSRLGAHAHPIDPRRQRERPVGLDADLEAYLRVKKRLEEAKGDPAAAKKIAAGLAEAA